MGNDFKKLNKFSGGPMLDCSDWVQRERNTIEIEGNKLVITSRAFQVDFNGQESERPNSDRDQRIIDLTSLKEGTDLFPPRDHRLGGMSFKPTGTQIPYIFKEKPISEVHSANVEGLKKFTGEFIDLKAQHAQYPTKQKSYKDSLSSKKQALGTLETQDSALAKKCLEAQASIPVLTAQNKELEDITSLFHDLETVSLGGESSDHE